LAQLDERYLSCDALANKSRQMTIDTRGDLRLGEAKVEVDEDVALLEA
jgi:hypothetical protein